MSNAHPTKLGEPLTIRAARTADEAALERLAQLDSARLPRGPLLVAEVGDELRAAYSLREGRALADPFRPTADLVALLALRSRQIEVRARGRHRWARLTRPASAPAPRAVAQRPSRRAAARVS